MDDILIIARGPRAVQAVTNMLKSKFSINDLGAMRSFLGLKFIWTANSVYLSQFHFISVLLQSFGMQHRNAVSTPTVTPPVIVEIDSHTY